MTETSPGRAAYEAWSSVMQGVQALDWSALEGDEKRFWEEDVAKAAVDAAPGTGWAKDHAHRYLVAVYGKDYVYRAPETFENAVERWIWAVAAGEREMAEECVAAIEKHMAERGDRS